VSNTSAALAHNADRDPEGTALLGFGTMVTHAELDARVSALAAGLRARGVGPGDVVGVLLNNRFEHLETIHAVNRLGAVFLLMNYRLAPREWLYLLSHSGARTLVVEPELWDGLHGVVGELESPLDVVLVGDPERAAADGIAGYDAVVAAGAGAVIADAPVEPGDLQRLMYTSGTTARPKGVRITYANVLYKSLGQITELGLTSADRVLAAGPLYHVGGLDLPGISVLHLGGSVVVLPRFEPAAALEAIEHHRVTIAWLAPTMVNMIVQRDDLAQRDTSSVRLIILGGEKMPMALFDRLQAAFPQAWIADAYGLTETVGGDTFLDPAHVVSKRGSVGKPILYVQARIVDDGSNDVAAGELGEIALRGPKVFDGYWRDPEATARAFADGWFLTGDIGSLDCDGFLSIEDRKGDLIVSGGENIASSEVERVLYDHPSVLEAAVVALADERWGQVPHAFVVTGPGLELTDEAVIAHCREHLARFKVPKRVTFVAQLPRNPSGKVLKRELRDLSRTG
jgi:fatty-acyl-CoA synthase